MSLTLVAPDDRGSLLHLTDGQAEVMGEGLFIILQTDETGQPQSVVLTEADLKLMLSTTVAPPITALAA